ncbi:MAG: LacI family DNA-binding transcriptional regulator [Acidimicrobiales bacterium]
MEQAPERQVPHTEKGTSSGRVGNIRPTIHDVARIAGVSTASVSRALSGRGNVSSAIKDQVKQAADRVGYQPHLVARSLVKRRTWLLGIIVPDISNPFFPELVKAIQVSAEKEGYGTLLSQVIGDTSFSHQVELLGAGRVDGIITVGLSVGQLDSRKLAGSMPSVPGSVALVCLDRDSALPGSTLIAVDHCSSAQMVVSHLASYGHRDILYIDGPSGLDLSVQRRLGYENAMRSVNGDAGGQMVLQGDLSEASGYRAISQALAEALSFTAVFAANDLMAIGAMSALRNAGLVVPEDVSVVGFDDITIAAYVSPGLTTIHQPTDLMGAVAAEVAIAELEGGHRHRSSDSRNRVAVAGAQTVVSDYQVPEPVSAFSDAVPTGSSRSDLMHRGSQAAGLAAVEFGSGPSGKQLQIVLSEGLAHESWPDGRRTITFNGSLVVRGSTSAVSVRRIIPGAGGDGGDGGTGGVASGSAKSEQSACCQHPEQRHPVAGVVD